ncbi:MAG: hypothetical protein RLZZ584_329 [Pseudomonadota bacterium]|jgi:hypothetical protein
MTLQPSQATLFCTIAMLAVTTYFFFGSVPLLILKHDNPMDSRFIRSFYVTYYRIALVTASATTVSYLVAARSAFALGAGAIVVVTLVLRRTFLPRMDALRERIQADDPVAIASFRQIHKSAIAINVVQLVLILYALTRF